MIQMGKWECSPLRLVWHAIHLTKALGTHVRRHCAVESLAARCAPVLCSPSAAPSPQPIRHQTCSRAGSCQSSPCTLKDTIAQPQTETSKTRYIPFIPTMIVPGFIIQDRGTFVDRCLLDLYSATSGKCVPSFRHDLLLSILTSSTPVGRTLQEITPRARAPFVLPNLHFVFLPPPSLRSSRPFSKAL